ncbi:MAG: PqqD family protein [Myxococcaceae bacterium]
MNGVPRVNPEAAVQRVGDRLLAVGPDDCLHAFEDEAGQVSEVAERIVELSDGARTVSQIAAVIHDEFEVELDVAQTDVEKFVQLLVEKKVLVL